MEADVKKRFDDIDKKLKNLAGDIAEIREAVESADTSGMGYMQSSQIIAKLDELLERSRD